MKIDELVEKGEGVKEILSQTPNWPIRWGTSIIFSILIVLIIISGFIKYPDVIPARITLTTSHPPARIVAHSSGKLNSILYNENDLVEEGSLLGIIDNPAKSSDVLELISKLKIDSKELLKEQSIDLPDNLILGDLEKEYSTFYRIYNELQLFRNLDPISKEIRFIQSEIKEHLNLLDKQTKQKDFQQAELQLVQMDYERNQSLFRSKAISSKQLEDKERELLQAKRINEQTQLDIANTRIRVSELNKDLTLLKVRNEERLKQYQLNLVESHKNLLGALAAWKQQFLLISPIQGKVTYLKYWSNNQNVTTGDEVMVIVPNSKQQIIGKLLIPLQNSGKVKPAQRVNIYLENFPYEEFGILNGKIKSMSLVPKDNLYSVEVVLPAGLKTSYHKTLDIKQEMQGSAEIITEDLSLLERIFYQLRALGRNQ